MTGVATIAATHYRGRQALTRRTLALIRRQWRAMPTGALAAAWSDGTGATVLTAVEAAQTTAASGATAYVTAALIAQGIDPEATDVVNPAAFAGLTASGGPMAAVLHTPVTSALRAEAVGLTSTEAAERGLRQLLMIASTEIADAGRRADQAAIVADPGAGGYVRMLSPPSCGRCAVLAGRFYAYSAGFARHPRCDCTHIPSRESIAGTLTTSPKKYFDSLSAADQAKHFTKSGANAIRDGADIGRVVNSRLKMYTTTLHGQKVRATYSGSSLTRKRIRLTTDQIYADARRLGLSRTEVRDLLRTYAYLR